MGVLAMINPLWLVVDSLAILNILVNISIDYSEVVMSIFLKALAFLIFAMPTFGVHVNPVFVIAMALITSAFLSGA